MERMAKEEFGIEIDGNTAFLVSLWVGVTDDDRDKLWGEAAVERRGWSKGRTIGPR